MDVLEKMIFLNKFFWDVGGFYASVFGVDKMGLEVEISMPKLSNQVRGQDIMMLETNFTVLRDTVLVLTLPG